MATSLLYRAYGFAVCPRIEHIGTLGVFAWGVSRYLLQRSRSLRKKQHRYRHLFRMHIAMGSDSYRQDTLAEAQYIDSLHVVPRDVLLKMWTETTAESIFPDRRIGRLKPRYEASFLVLSGNPLDDFSNVTHITKRVKQGHPLW